MQLTLQTRKPSHSAFTLLELLVGVIMMAIVLAAISATFFGSMKLRDSTREAIKDAQVLQNAIHQIKADLNSITIPSTNIVSLDSAFLNTLSEEVPFTLSGEMISDTMDAPNGSTGFQFYCASGWIDTNLPFGDMQRVGYTVRAPMDRYSTNGFELIRITTRNLLATSIYDRQEQIRLSGIQSLSWAFYDGSIWQEFWDSSSMDPKMPTAIRMGLTMLPKGLNRPERRVQIIVPVSVELPEEDEEGDTAL